MTSCQPQQEVILIIAMSMASSAITRNVRISDAVSKHRLAPFSYARISLKNTNIDRNPDVLYIRPVQSVPVFLYDPEWFDIGMRIKPWYKKVTCGDH